MLKEVRPATTITEQIADYVVGLSYDDIPPTVVDRAKELLVFHIGAAFRGIATQSGQQAVRTAMDISGSDCGYSIIGEPGRAGLLEAVFANSSLMTYSGLADLLFPTAELPGLVVHPAAWALGEMGKASGRELLTAVVIGYDVMAKLHNGQLPYELAVPRPTKAATEPIGVAATAARLLKLSRGQTADAMGHAGSTVAGIYEGMEQLWLMHPHASRNGVLAAMLANAGFTAGRTIVEGRYGVYRTFFLQDVPDVVHEKLRRLGSDFELANARTTRYPVSATNALPIQLTAQLVTEHSLTPSRVAQVDLVLPASRAAREEIYGVYPKGPTSVVALALTGSRLDAARFEEEFDDELIAARDKVRLQFEDGHGFFYARVELTTTDDRRYTAEGGGDVPPAQPPLDWADWLACGRPILSDAQVDRLAELIRDLENVDDVGEVLACLVPGARL
ncbi:MAG: MmgE/PrpD family protein [Kribbellaceae bacterium]